MAIFGLEKIDRQYATTDSISCSQGDLGYVGIHLAPGCDRTPRGVGNPVFRGPIDRRDAFITDHKAADITALFLNELLNVENRMMITSKEGLVLEDGLSRFAIIHLG